MHGAAAGHGNRDVEHRRPLEGVAQDVDVAIVAVQLDVDAAVVRVQRLGVLQPEPVGARRREAVASGRGGRHSLDVDAVRVDREIPLLADEDPIGLRVAAAGGDVDRAAVGCALMKLASCSCTLLGQSARMFDGTVTRGSAAVRPAP